LIFIRAPHTSIPANAYGTPVIRERKAMSDIESAADGGKVTFHDKHGTGFGASGNGGAGTGNSSPTPSRICGLNSTC
jgi:hypothetical protein